jgi:hypothetical protein
MGKYEPCSPLPPTVSDTRRNSHCRFLPKLKIDRSRTDGHFLTMAECHGRPALHNSSHHPNPPKYTIAATVIPAAQTYHHCSSFHSGSLPTFILSDPSPHALLDPRSTCPFVIHFTQPILEYILNTRLKQSERERERKLT